MSEQKNNMESMNFGTGSTLEELFGDVIPQVDLGDQFPAPEQAVQPQAMPVTNPPAAAPEGQPAQPEQVQQPANPQAAPSPAPQPVQQPTAQPQTSGTQTAPAAQPTGQVVDLFGAVVEDGADALLAKLAGKRPVFEYGSITDEIEDPNLTFEQLRVKMSADCPELEARSHVSWTMSYAGITERVSSADAGIYETKAKIEKSKKFKEALKKMKPKDKEPVCTVKPTVTAQKKGVLQFPRYKGLFGSTEQAEQSNKAIAYIPAQDGRVYEMRRNEIGTFTAPSMHIAELEDIRAGFQMSLPRLPAALLTQIIAFFRRVCVDYGRDVEALVNVLWDREKGGYVLHVPPQRIDKASVETDLSAQPDPSRYLHVMDVHSHNTMAARFSRTDDLDEQAARLYMVIGRLDRYYPDIRCRFACGGRHVEIPAEQVCERTDVPFAPEWLEAVQETGLKEAA